MKKKIAAILIVSLLSVSMAMAQNPGQYAPKGHRGQGGKFDGGFGDRSQGFGMVLRMADKLELTDSQKAEIKAQMEKNGLARIDKEAELEKAELKLRNLRMNDASDSEILAAIDKVGQLKTDLQKMRFQHRSQMKSILTEDQLNKLDELRKEFRKDRSGRRGRFDGRGQRSGGPDSDKTGNNPPLRPDCWRN